MVGSGCVVHVDRVVIWCLWVTTVGGTARVVYTSRVCGMALPACFDHRLLPFRFSQASTSVNTKRRDRPTKTHGIPAACRLSTVRSEQFNAVARPLRLSKACGVSGLGGFAVGVDALFCMGNVFPCAALPCEGRIVADWYPQNLTLLFVIPTPAGLPTRRHERSSRQKYGWRCDSDARRAGNSKARWHRQKRPDSVLIETGLPSNPDLIR